MAADPKITDSFALMREMSKRAPPEREFCYNNPMGLMSICRFHPDRAASVYCQKHELGYCQECLDLCKACTDPCLYCKFRPGCVIWELCRKEAKKRCKEEAATEAS